MYKTQSVYVMYNLDTNRVKIGITGNIKTRLDSITSASGCLIVVLYVSKPMKNAEYVEGQIHNELKKYRIIGEWFNASIMDAINITSYICGDTYQVNDDRIKAKIIPLHRYENIGGNMYRDINGKTARIEHICGYWFITYIC